MNTSSPRPTKNEYIDLVHGAFKRTNYADLERAFQTFASSKMNHLAVFFHGGLVGRSNAMATAGKLIEGYRRAGAYPFFFIWNSDLLTALQRHLSPFASDPVIRRVIEQHIVFVSRQMSLALAPPNEQAYTLRDIGSRGRAGPPPSLEALAATGRMVDASWAGRAPGVTLPSLAQTIAAIQTFEAILVKDRTVADNGRWLNQSKRFTAELGTGIMARVWERIRSRHDHGLYTTLIEEIAIAIGLDLILAGIWQSMKADIDDAFRGDQTTFGGTAFLECLKSAFNANTRLTLIGHSGGSVYINRLLNAIDDGLPSAVKAEVVFIAPALSFDVFAETIQSGVFLRRVDRYRFFALDNKCEGGYWEVPGVYDKSLLYLVSALCERDYYADKALVGMERYWSGNPPYSTPNIRSVTDAIALGERVWSPTRASAPAGYRANAHEHGKFPVERETIKSVEEFLGSAVESSQFGAQCTELVHGDQFLRLALAAPPIMAANI